MNAMLKLQIKWFELISSGHGWIKKTLWFVIFHGVINATYIHLQKSKGENFVVVEYYSFKLKATSSKCKQWLIIMTSFTMRKKMCFVIGLVTQILSCKKHLQLIVFICCRC
jgi:hypothetical protein